ncbi:hypothetical protein HZC34_03190 [Candidatus Saganbacteria bacterium]|nr:hypothetical protein [Candidatus Saganbacteria bacterium]
MTKNKKKGNREPCLPAGRVHSQVALQKENFFPLTYFREVEDLICGATTVAEHIKRKSLDQELRYPWDLLSNLSDDMKNDFKIMRPEILGKVHETAVLINKKDIHIGKDSVISACAVIDATQSPIFIGEKTIVHPHAFLRGPLYIGKNCRIAGEIVHSIFMDYVNKGHYGFIGHSYICPWVNLGAGTTNSNLKNNYSGVKVYIGGKLVDSGQTFMGCLIGDHAKSSIGSLIYTGCVIGPAANLFGQAYYKKFVPAFSWGGGNIPYKLEDAMQSAKKAMARRDVQFSSHDEELFKKVFELTAPERA